MVINIINEKDLGEVFEYYLEITGKSSSNKFRVTLNKKYWTKITKGELPAKAFVKNCFKFLLDKEPVEAILTRFDIEVIKNYFPSFEKEIHQYQEHS